MGRGPLLQDIKFNFSGILYIFFLLFPSKCIKFDFDWSLMLLFIRRSVLNLVLCVWSYMFLSFFLFYHFHRRILNLTLVCNVYICSITGVPNLTFFFTFLTSVWFPLHGLNFLFVCVLIFNLLWTKMFCFDFNSFSLKNLANQRNLH